MARRRGKKTVQIEDRWITFSLEKEGRKLKGKLAQELGFWATEEDWTTMEETLHEMGDTALNKILGQKISSLGITADSSIRELLDALNYGIINGDILYQTYLTPKVVDPDGNPIEDAKIQVAGRYIFERYYPEDIPPLNPDEKYDLTAEAPGFKPEEILWEPVIGDWEPTVVLTPFTMTADEPYPPEDETTLEEGGAANEETQ